MQQHTAPMTRDTKIRTGSNTQDSMSENQLAYGLQPNRVNVRTDVQDLVVASPYW